MAGLYGGALPPMPFGAAPFPFGLPGAGGGETAAGMPVVREEEEVEAKGETEDPMSDALMRALVGRCKSTR